VLGFCEKVCPENKRFSLTHQFAFLEFTQLKQKKKTLKF
jgi:hypothetical protein